MDVKKVGHVGVGIYGLVIAASIAEKFFTLSDAHEIYICFHHFW